MGDDPKQVDGLSIVCVYNDPAVRADCLDRSIHRYTGPVEVDYLPVDNTEHAFTTAGAALNHGARRARHDVVVLVHQDVYLHSIDRLAEAARHLGDGPDGWAVLGASGVPTTGPFVGALRDRVELIGDPAPTPRPVESVDEVLFMVRRDQLLRDPLTEDPLMAWHAYAIEYCLRMRRAGRRVGAVDLAITHNSLTLNLARLDVAYGEVADQYPELLPVRATCRTIGARPDGWPLPAPLRRHRWLWRWSLRSREAARIRRRFGARVVLADIRHEVDQLHTEPDNPLRVLNLDRAGAFAPVGGEHLELVRVDRPVQMTAAADLDELRRLLTELPDDANVLVTNLVLDDLARLPAPLVASSLIGLQAGDLWLARGPAFEVLPDAWRTTRALPWGRAAYAAAARVTP